MENEESLARLQSCSAYWASRARSFGGGNFIVASQASREPGSFRLTAFGSPLRQWVNQTRQRGVRKTR